MTNMTEAWHDWTSEICIKTNKTTKTTKHQYLTPESKLVLSVASKSLTGSYISHSNERHTQINTVYNPMYIHEEPHYISHLSQAREEVKVAVNEHTSKFSVSCFHFCLSAVNSASSLSLRSPNAQIYVHLLPQPIVYFRWTVLPPLGEKKESILNSLEKIKSLVQVFYLFILLVLLF